VVADATRLESAAEKSVSRLIDDALPWPGYTALAIAVNRADMVRELRPLLATGKPAGDAGLAPELEATWQRLADGHPRAIPRLALTAARHGLAAATVLRAVGTRAESDQASQEFLELIRPADWEDAPSDRHWLRARAQETWQQSGVAGLLETFLEPRAREPGRFILGALLNRVASAIPAGRGGNVPNRLDEVARLAGLDRPWNIITR
jgi:hypothetical protein